MKDIGVIGICEILVRISGIILLPILTRTLGAYGYGLWTQAQVTIGLMTPILILGLHASIGRIFPSKNLQSIGEDFSSLFFILFPLLLSFSIFLFLYPFPVANLIFEGEYFVVRFVALIIFVWAFDQLFFRVFQAFREMKKYALVRVLTRYGELGLASYLVLNGYGLFGALSAILTIRASTFLILTFILAKKLGVHKPNISKTKEYLRYGVPLIPSFASLWIINTSDRYLIGYFLGITSVGYYSPAYTIGMAFPMMISGIIYFALKPTLSMHYDEGNMDKVRRLLKLFMKYMTVFVAPLFFGVLLFHLEITELLTTPKIAREGSFIAIFIAFNGIIFIFYRIFQFILQLEKKSKTIGVVKTSAALLNFFFNLFLIPWIGILGAAISTLSSFTFMGVIYILISRKYLTIIFKLSTYAKIIFSSLVMYISLFVIKGLIDIYFICLILLGVSIYFLILFLIKGIKKEEYKFIISTLTNSR